MPQTPPNTCSLCAFCFLKNSVVPSFHSSESSVFTDPLSISLVGAQWRNSISLKDHCKQPASARARSVTTAGLLQERKMCEVHTLSLNAIILKVHFTEGKRLQSTICRCWRRCRRQKPQDQQLQMMWSDQMHISWWASTSVTSSSQTSTWVGTRLLCRISTAASMCATLFLVVLCSACCGFSALTQNLCSIYSWGCSLT